jgi:hypothetical protein
MSTRNLTVSQYFIQTMKAFGINDFLVRRLKDIFFGFPMATTGCQKGSSMEAQCARRRSHNNNNRRDW